MQAIALENNLSETAFVVADGERWNIRWFTPAEEVEFCGHATIASAHVLMHELGVPSPVRFTAQIGELIVAGKNQRYEMDAPVTSVDIFDEVPGFVTEIFGPHVTHVFQGRQDLFIVFETVDDVAACQPDMNAIASHDYQGMCITAPGADESDQDIVSRFFVPAQGIPEDPVTGSIHAALAPYWAARLGKQTLKARQISARGGDLDILLKSDRVTISGRAVTYMKGEIYLPG